MQAQQISKVAKSISTQLYYCDCDFPPIESSTLAIGNECVDFFDGDAKKAIEKFQSHKIEIMLTRLHKVMSTQKNPNAKVFAQLLEFIKICDDGA